MLLPIKSEIDDGQAAEAVDRPAVGQGVAVLHGGVFQGQRAAAVDACPAVQDAPIQQCQVF